MKIQPKLQPRLSNIALKTNYNQLNQTIKKNTKECQTETEDQEADINTLQLEIEALKLESEAFKLTNEASKLENAALSTKSKKILFVMIFISISILAITVGLGLNLFQQKNDLQLNNDKLQAKVQSLESQQSYEEKLKKALYNQLNITEEVISQLTANRTQVVHKLTAARSQVKKLKDKQKLFEEKLKTEHEALKNETIELENTENREEKCLNDLKSHEEGMSRLTAHWSQLVHEFNAAQKKCLDDLSDIISKSPPNPEWDYRLGDHTFDQSTYNLNQVKSQQISDLSQSLEPNPLTNKIDQLIEILSRLAPVEEKG